MEQLIVSHEMAIAGAPELIGIVGLEVVGPSIVEYGTDAQKSAFIPGILSAADIWCQGFSEPEAGSDLASLRTVAEDRATTSSFAVRRHGHLGPSMRTGARCSLGPTWRPSRTVASPT